MTRGSLRAYHGDRVRDRRDGRQVGPDVGGVGGSHVGQRLHTADGLGAAVHRRELVRRDDGRDLAAVQPMMPVASGVRLDVCTRAVPPLVTILPPWNALAASICDTETDPSPVTFTV